MANDDIRQAAAKAKVRLWQVAEEIGKSDVAFSKMIRRELPPEKKLEIYAAISRLST